MSEDLNEIYLLGDPWKNEKYLGTISQKWCLAGDGTVLTAVFMCKTSTKNKKNTASNPPTPPQAVHTL